MRAIACALGLTVSAALTVASAAVDGDLRLERLASTVFANTRTLRVLLPPGYGAPANRDRRYPVLYLNDGQNLFDAETSTFTGQEWRVDETVHRLVAAGRIAEIIVVGIDHAGRRERFHEYFPYPDPFLRPPDPDPQGRRYPAFLVDEVVPYVEGRYRADRMPAHRGLGGSSAGALAAIYTVAMRPGVFSRLLVESPSIYVNDAQILKDAAGVRAWPERIVLGAGTAEGGQTTCDPAALAAEPEVVTDLRRFARVLGEAGVEAARVRLTVTPCARHDEDAWAARLPDALTFLYAPDVPAAPSRPAAPRR